MGYELELQSECLRNHCAFFNSLTLLHKCFDVLRNLSSLLRLRDHHVLMSPKSKFLLTTYAEINFQLEICIMDLFLLLVTSGKALFFAAEQPVPCRAVWCRAQGCSAPRASSLLRVLGEQPPIPPWSVPCKLFGTNMALL